jgi:hypothetical protein
MKILITENKLQSLFNGMMSEYTDMVDHERDYDYYDYSKGRYMDYTPMNFYMDDEEIDGYYIKLVHLKEIHFNQVFDKLVNEFLT